MKKQYVKRKSILQTLMIFFKIISKYNQFFYSKLAYGEKFSQSLKVGLPKNFLRLFPFLDLSCYCLLPIELYF